MEDCLANLIDVKLLYKRLNYSILAWRFVTNIVQAARDEQLQCFHMYVKERNEDSDFSAFFNTPWIQPYNVEEL